MEREEFEDIENQVWKYSSCYNNSTSFRQALHFIKQDHPLLYKELIIIEYKEMTGVQD